MPNTMNRQQDAQAAIEALERRRLQNRVAQKNRRKRQAELELKRQHELGRQTEKRQRQQDGESQVSNKTSENPSSFEQNISTLPTFEPHISQSEVIQYEPWQQESFVSATSDAYVDGIGACDNIETPIPNYMQDIQLESLQYSSSTPISSTKRRSLTAAFETTKDPEAPREVNIQAQGSRIELAQQHASQAVPTRMISAPPTPSPTQISGACWLDNRGKTALHISAERGNIRIVRMLLHYGVDVNGTDSWGRSALHYASRGAHIDVVAHLLTVGADPEARDYEGRSPLHAAAEAESEAVIQLLAEEGADLNAAIGISSSSSIGEEGEDIPPIVET